MFFENTKLIHPFVPWFFRTLSEAIVKLETHHFDVNLINLEISMKLLKTSTALLLMFIASQAFADPVFYCDNSNNENNNWATVPGNQQGLQNAHAACTAQGGTSVVIAGPSLR